MDVSSCCGGGDNSDLSSSEALLSDCVEVNEIGDSLAPSLQIQHQPVSNVDAKKLLHKCVSLPCPSRNQDALSDPEQPSRSAYARSLSLPSALNLVSALKGGREKHGLSPRKLSVSWAADVYDPTPTSVSHTVNNYRGGRKQYKSKSSKKNGKKGQKGSSSRGGKDNKKQSYPRKVSANSAGCYNRSMDNRVTLTDPPDSEFGDLTIGGTESNSYCGSSFLKKSLSSMHYPVAEAL